MEYISPCLLQLPQGGRRWRWLGFSACSMASRKPRVVGQRGPAAVRAHRAARSALQKSRDNKQQQARLRTQVPRRGPYITVPTVGQRVAYYNKAKGRVIWTKVRALRDGNAVGRRSGGPGAWVVVGGRHDSEHVVHISELRFAAPRRRRQPLAAQHVAAAAPPREATPKPRTPKMSATPGSSQRSLSSHPTDSRQGKRLLAAMRR